MATRHLHLVKRGAQYGWRRRLPAALSRALRITQLRRSLGTSNPATARRRARLASAAFDDWLVKVELTMTAGRPAPTPEQLNDIVNSIFRRILDDKERERPLRAPGPPPAAYEEEDGRVVSEAEYERDRWQDALRLNECERVDPLITEMMTARGITLDPQSEPFRLLARRAMRAVVRALEIDAARDDADYGDDAILHGSPAPTTGRAVFLPASPSSSYAQSPMLGGEFGAYYPRIASHHQPPC